MLSYRISIVYVGFGNAKKAALPTVKISTKFILVDAIKDWFQRSTVLHKNYNLYVAYINLRLFLPPFPEKSRFTKIVLAVYLS